MKLSHAVITDITDVFLVHSPKGRVTQIQNRATYGLSLCIDGQISYRLHGRTYISDRDHAVLLPMGQSYTLHGDRTGDFPVINFKALEPLPDDILVLRIHDRERLLKNFEEIKRLSLHENYRAKRMSLLYEMLHEISMDQEHGVLDVAVKYIYDNYHRAALTNTQLSELCSISEVYFRRLFNERFHTSPKQFILDLRIQKAKQLLSQGYDKIWAIAEACGFESTYHFCRVFKQRTGISPSEWRRRNQTLGI